MSCREYSKIVDEIYLYDGDKGEVEVRKCAYNNKTNTLCKGKTVNAINGLVVKFKWLTKINIK